MDRALDELRGAMMSEFGKIHTRMDLFDGRLKGVVDDHLEDREVNARYRRKQKALERETERLSEIADGPNWKPNPDDNTGTHDLAVMKGHVDEMRANRTWWRENLGKTALTIAAAIVIAGLTACGTYVIAKLPGATPAAHP